MKELLVHVVSPAKAQLFITYAAYIARDMNLTVRYLHVYTPPNFPMGLPGSLNAAASVNQRDIDRKMEKARHHFDVQIDNLYATDPELPLLEYSVEVGYPSEIINEYCESKKVDTIMLSSSKGKSVFYDDSSNVEIIRNISCPVWIIPEGITYKPFSEILYATDYHKEDLPSMKQLVGLASKFPANITAVHITDNISFREKAKGEDFINMIKKQSGYKMMSVKVLQETRGEPMVSEMHDFALQMDADLIVLLRENRRFLDRLLHGSRSEKIARETRLPVLIFNEKRKKPAYSKASAKFF